MVMRTEGSGWERMLVRRVKVSNFKTFRQAEIALEPFNVIIGSNAAGKSNFIGIFKFLRDIAEFGLVDAVGLQGGIEFLRPVWAKNQGKTEIEVDIDFGANPVSITFCAEASQTIEATVFGCTHRIALDPPGREPHVREEELRATCRHLLCTNGRRSCTLGEGTLLLGRDEKGTLHYEIRPGEVAARINLGSWTGKPLSPEVSILERPMCFPPLSPLAYHLSQEIRGITLLDLDPSLAKRTSRIAGRVLLEPDGSNLSVALHRILENRSSKQRFLRLIGDLLPFVEDVRVERSGDRTLIASVSERFGAERYLPAALLSDGTVHLMALVVALFFEERSPLLLEEPCRNIHPYLVSRMVEMMQDIAERGERQILVTTHNPELVKYAGTERIVMLRRGQDGGSLVSRPHENEEIRTFLEDMGIEELYIQNLLS